MIRPSLERVVASGATASSIHTGLASQRPLSITSPGLSDPRQHGKVLHPLPEILLLVFAANHCPGGRLRGAESVGNRASDISQVLSGLDQRLTRRLPGHHRG
jgi:hypothetical protein